MQKLEGELTTPLAEMISTLVTHHLEEVGINNATNLRHLLLEKIEASLFEVVIAHCKYNQSKAANILGLTRTTCRQKLRYYFDGRYCKLPEKETCEEESI